MQESNLTGVRTKLIAYLVLTKCHRLTFVKRNLKTVISLHAIFERPNLIGYDMYRTDVALSTALMHHARIK
jgi:hypothetical protein